MAVLEKIRKRTVFLILVIGLALFAFVISGIFSRNTTPDQLVIGSVNGDDISYREFSTQVENTTRNMGGSIGQGYIVNALWQQAVQGKIIDQQFEKLGISVGKEQIFAMIKRVPQYAQDPQFQDEKGQFSIAKFAQVIAQIKKVNPAQYQQWQAEEKSYVDAAKRELYLSLIRAGLGVTLKDGEDAYHRQADKVTFNYVTLPYTSIPDSEVKVSDAEIDAYVKAHKKQFEQKEMRNIQFVWVTETASEADIKQVEQSLQALNAPRVVYNSQRQANDTLPGFGALAAKDVPQFVNENSDVPFDSLYVSKVIKEKKAKQLSEKLKGSTLEQVAQASGQAGNIQTAENVTQEYPALPGQGSEPSVLGAAFALPQGKVSQPIAGDNGVYVIQVTQKDIAPALPNYSSYMAPLRNQKLNRASQDLFSALEATADIKDNRAKFY